MAKNTVELEICLFGAESDFWIYPEDYYVSGLDYLEGYSVNGVEHIMHESEFKSKELGKSVERVPDDTTGIMWYSGKAAYYFKIEAEEFDVNKLQLNWRNIVFDVDGEEVDPDVRILKNVTYDGVEYELQGEGYGSSGEVLWGEEPDDDWDDE